MILLGILLRRQGMTSEVFLNQSDRLIYYIFFPVLLFWKIGAASHATAEVWKFCLVCVGVVVSMFLLSTLVMRLFRISSFKAGSFSQSCYRFNTYIGVAVVLNAFGEEGIAMFGVLLGMVIPIINLFAVSMLIWHSGREMESRQRVRVLARSLAGNPLILGCLAGLCYSRLVGHFPLFINNTLALISMVTLPMALLSIGGALTFEGVRKNLAPALLAATCKLLILPVSGYLALSCFGIEGLGFKVGMLFFSLPASTAIYVLSSQLNSDLELASSAIVLSTLLSFFSLSVALLL